MTVSIKVPIKGLYLANLGDSFLIGTDQGEVLWVTNEWLKQSLQRGYFFEDSRHMRLLHWPMPEGKEPPVNHPVEFGCFKLADQDLPDINQTYSLGLATYDEIGPVLKTERIKPRLYRFGAHEIIAGYGQETKTWVVR